MPTIDRLMPITVQCPQCGQLHHETLAIQLEAKHDDSQLIFAGPPPDSIEGVEERLVKFIWDVVLLCPTRGTRFSQSIEVEASAKERVIGVSVAKPLSTGTDVAVGIPTPERAESALDVWRGESIKTGRAYASLMLTTSTAAVGVYFAVLKYLGFETALGASRYLGLIPPMLFLGAAVAYALALRPVLELVSSERFQSFMDGRLRRVNLFITVGTAAYVVAIGVSACLFWTLS